MGASATPPAITRNANSQADHCGIISGFFAPSISIIADVSGLENFGGDCATACGGTRKERAGDCQASHECCHFCNLRAPT